MKSLSHLAVAALSFVSAVEAAVLPQDTQPYGQNYPRRVIAGVTVIDTPIVREAQQLARQHMSDAVYKHVIRGWLFGALIVKHNETLSKTVDLEVQAVAALLHDIGWDRSPGSPFISADRRFEVDGAIAARDFVRASSYGGSSWDERRLQLLFDSIAFHAERSFAEYKETNVMITSRGILSDFQSPNFGITDPEYDAVVSEFPNGDLRTAVNDTIIWLCQTKPKTTYDIWTQPWGEKYVANYSAVGGRIFDVVEHLP